MPVQTKQEPVNGLLWGWKHILFVENYITTTMNEPDVHISTANSKNYNAEERQMTNE